MAIHKSKEELAENAKIFKEQLKLYKFKQVVFAIPKGKNFNAFRKVFE